MAVEMNNKPAREPMVAPAITAVDGPDAAAIAAAVELAVGDEANVDVMITVASGDLGWPMLFPGGAASGVGAGDIAVVDAVTLAGNFTSVETTASGFAGSMPQKLVDTEEVNADPPQPYWKYPLA
jgi:hypothetical protein